MAMPIPLVSVVMPAYNSEQYIAEAIESILNQTFSDFEFIIINDGSTDRTEAIILSYNDPRIVYIENETNLNIVASLNKGIAVAQGRYIARMDADDISLPERLAKQHEFMQNYPDIDVCGTFVKTFGAAIKHWIYPTTPEAIKVALLFFSPLAHPTVFGKAAFFKQSPYDINYQKAEDFQLWASHQLTHQFANIPEFLLEYRLHNQQTAKTDSDRQLQLSDLIRKQQLEKFGVIFTDEEFKTHVAISRYQPIDIDRSEQWLYKLYTHNQTKPLFDTEALNTFIFERWWIILNNFTYQGLSVFLHYLSSKKIPKIYMPKRKQIKFFIKCLFKYEL